jgi:apolipoprotein N-acyltransferase
MILAGAFLGLSFPPFRTWFFVYPGVVIMLYLVLTAARLRQAFSWGYFVLLVFNAISVYWIANWSGDDIFLKIGGTATVLAHPLFMLIPLLVFYGINKALKSEFTIFLFPFIWVGYEYLDNIWQLSFPWLELGNTETYNLNRIQYYDLAGVHGATFIICLTSVLLYYLIAKIYNGSWKAKSLPAIVSAILIIFFLSAPYHYSHQKLNSDNSKYYYSTDSAKIIKTTVIQPNIDPERKWKGNTDSIVDVYINALNLSLKTNPDLFVIHETAVPYPFFDPYFFYNTNKFLNFINLNNKYLLMGIPHRYYYTDSLTAPKESKIASITRRRFNDFNSAVLIEPGKQLDSLAIHEKAKLVPFSERPPYQEYLPFLSKWIKWGVGISNWEIGTDSKVFSLSNPTIKKNAKFISLICFESVFSDYVSEGVKNGAEFIIIITNDGWFGNSSGPVQHDRYAVLRAIENRKWIIRAAQTGISDFVDPLGNQYEKTELNTEAVITKTIIANDEKTFYAVNGDIIGKAGYYILIICLLLSIVLYAYNRNKSKAA